jgi:hypothetical protein
VSYNTCESFLDELLGYVATDRVKKSAKDARAMVDSHILASHTDGRGFALLVFPFAGSDEIDLDSNMLPDQLFPEEFTGLMGIIRLLRV